MTACLLVVLENLNPLFQFTVDQFKPLAVAVVLGYQAGAVQAVGNGKAATVKSKNPFA